MVTYHFCFFETVLGREHSGKDGFKKIHWQLLFLGNHLNKSAEETGLRNQINPQSCGTSFSIQIGVLYHSMSKVLLVCFDFLCFSNDVFCDKSFVLEMKTSKTYP